MASIQDACPGDVGPSASHLASHAQRRKRGSRACLNCRIRKVRCDVTQNGVPCTNCRADAQLCSIPRRSRKHRLSNVSSLQPILLGGQALHDTGVPTQDGSARQSQAYAAGELRRPDRTSAALLLEEALQYQGLEVERRQLSQEHPLAEALPPTSNMPAAQDIRLTAITAQTGDAPLQTIEPRYSASSKSTNPPQAPHHTIDTGHCFERPHSNDHMDATDCPFLDTDFKSRIPPEDFEYLDHIGCLQVPQRTILDELLRAYFLYTHPHLPLVDEGEFWETYLHSQPGFPHSSRTSLFVFQAMLLVACSFVSSTTIQDLGFRSVRAARSIYYRRVKALYDFDVERSSLAKAQGALLMTFHVPLNQPHINTYWLGVAIHMAKVEDANRYTTYVGRDSARHNRLKRVWWCCIIRDRTMSLGLRRPINIISASFDEIWPPLTNHDLKSEIGRSCVRSGPVKTRLLQSLTALCKLCAVLTNVLQLLYPIDGAHGDEDRLELLKRIYTYTDELNEWHDEVASNTGMRDPHDKSLNVVTLFTSLLTIYFQSANAALCNYRIMLTVKYPSQYNFELLQTKTVLQAALRGIAQSLRAIIDADMITYSPVSMVAFLALPSICYNLDLSSHEDAQKASHGPGANIYQDFLRVLQLRYEGTDRALDNMSKLVNHMNLEDATSPSAARSASGNDHAERPELRRPVEMSGPAKRGTGIDIVISNPQKYLQMNNTLDFFLSRGRFPTKNDYLLDLLSSPAESDTSPSPNLINNSATGEATDPMARAHQADVADSVWATSSTGPNEMMASGETRTNNAEFSAMLTEDPFGQVATNPYDFSFEDFMTDGPNSGIEQLQNILYTYPDWP